MLLDELRNEHLAQSCARCAISQAKTSDLATLDGREVISLERCHVAHSGVRLRRLASASRCTAPAKARQGKARQGKAILSAMRDEVRDEVRDAIVRDAVLESQTWFTITDRRRLQAELQITKSRG